MRRGSCAPRVAGSVVVVGVGDMAVSDDPDAMLITYALGSCIGIAVFDPDACVGGLLHAMLPQSSIDEARARTRPAMFVDTGIPALFRACYELGASKQRLEVKLAGGSAINGTGADHFQIGKRNLLMARQLFWKNSVLVRAQDVGGSASRTMSLDVGTGGVMIRAGVGDIQL
ncbi:MAG TPA: chemotaxis protein CheD [Longimicrobiales bacterium]|nr:chemotaxis protein CheD [Longimicrobiales bacterium]